MTRRAPVAAVTDGILLNMNIGIATAMPLFAQQMMRGSGFHARSLNSRGHCMTERGGQQEGEEPVLGFHVSFPDHFIGAAAEFGSGDHNFISTGGFNV